MPALLFATFALAFAPASQGGGEAFEFPELALSLDLSAFEALVPQALEGVNEKGVWLGRLGASEVRIELDALPTAHYDFFEPEDVVETWRDSIRDADGEGREVEFVFQPIRCVVGEVGWVPILATTRASMRSRADASLAGSLFLLGGLLPGHGWSLRVDAWPALEAGAADALATGLETCVKYSGKPREPRWTDEEALALWKRFAPESTHKKYEKPVRTEHFIVLTNSPSPGQFVKKLEGWHAKIQKALPFEELGARRLLPILLFRTDDDFQTFYRAHHEMQPEEEVDEQSFSQDYWLATSLDDDDDHEHLLDLTKQILIVRLRAWGSNRWLRSGLRESVASAPKERVETLRAVKKGRFTPLAKLLDDMAWRAEESKLDQRGTSDEADYWEQSALWMDFLRDGPWPKDAFQRFLRGVSGLAAGDQLGVVAALRSVYGMEPDALQAKWVEFYKKK